MAFLVYEHVRRNQLLRIKIMNKNRKDRKEYFEGNRETRGKKSNVSEILAE